MIALCVLVAAGAAFAYSVVQSKKYSASASLLFRDPGFEQTLFGSQISQTTDPTREAATNLDLVSLEAVDTKTAQKIDSGLTPTDVESKMNIQQDGESDLVSVTATDTDPDFAARLANTFADAFVGFRRDADRKKVASAVRVIQGNFDALSPGEQASAQGQSLQHEISQLTTLKALQTGNAEVVQRAAVPGSPSSPKPVRNTALAAALGLILGLVLAFLFERLDRRIKDPRELEEAFGMPILGTVPDSKALASTGNGAAPTLPFDEAEALRMLRTRLRYFNVDREVRSVLVTSASPADGKSTVALYLALSAASAGSKTCLIEADFHHPSLAAYQGASPLPGLAEVLTHQSSLQSVVQHSPARLSAHGDDGDTRYLDLIVAGARPPNPAELLESQEMASLLQELSDEYDLIVIDTPPASMIADAIPLTKLVGGVLVVGQPGKTTRDEATHLNEQLRNLEAPLLGVVANRLRKGRGYAYGYRYGYYGGSNGSGEKDAAPGSGIKIGRQD